MPSAVSIDNKGSILQNIDSLESLTNGRWHMMHNGQFVFKNEDGYTVADISENREYTKKEYMQLPENAPFQMVNGKFIYHEKSPIDIHQRISGNLVFHIYRFLKIEELGSVWAAPFDVHFDDKNIYQPDIIFVSKKRNKIIKDWVFGSPDLVVEIVSPETMELDSVIKLAAYGKYHVKEYWLIDPEKKTLTYFENVDGKLEMRHNCWSVVL